MGNLREAKYFKGLESPVGLLDRYEVIKVLFDIINLRDPDTALHSEAMGECSSFIAQTFDPDNVLEYYYAGLVHDIGKIAIPDYILKSSKKLSAGDKKIVISHVDSGVEILSKAGIDGIVLDITKYHHERVDGSGYPFGLRGSSIPLSARIAAIADTYSTLVVGRRYSHPKTPAEALKIMKEEHHLFDNEILSWFLNEQMENSFSFKVGVG